MPNLGYTSWQHSMVVVSLFSVCAHISVSIEHVSLGQYEEIAKCKQAAAETGSGLHSGSGSGLCLGLGSGLWPMFGGGVWSTCQPVASLTRQHDLSHS